MPAIHDLDKMRADMSIGQVQDCCNKSVPIYVLSETNTTSQNLLKIVLARYLYARWFRPYRSDIEFGQFIAKTIWPLPACHPPGTPDGGLVDLAIPVHAAVCARAESGLRALGEVDPEKNDNGLWELVVRNPDVPKLPSTVSWRAFTEVKLDLQFYLLQPLFRAILIIIRNEAYHHTIADVAQLPVLLVRTGVEEGLSAPISFEPITPDKINGSEYRGTHRETAVRTTLGAAVDLVMELQAREDAAFGPKPDPAAGGLRSGCLFDGPTLRRIAETDYGWREGEYGPLKGPSSRWVDTEQYPEWTGQGAEHDAAWRENEARERRRAEIG